MTAEAGEVFEKGMQQFPRDAMHYQEYGRMLCAQAEAGDEAAAARAAVLLAKAVALDPNLSEAHYYLGKLSLEQGETQTAILHLELARKAAPELSKARYALSRAYRRAGRTPESAEELRAYHKLKAEEDKQNLGMPAVRAQLQ
jgi:lipopolysaccharide biosynthesis regulator YciM